MPGPAVQVPYRVAPLKAHARQELSDGLLLGVIMLHHEEASGGQQLVGAGGDGGRHLHAVRSPAVQRHVRVVQGSLRVGRHVRRRNVRRVGEHRIEGADQLGKCSEGIPLHQVHTQRLQVLTGVGDGVFGELHREHLGGRQFALDSRRDGAGTRAQVDDARPAGCSVSTCAQHFESFFDEQLRFGSGHEYARPDRQL